MDESRIISLYEKGFSINYIIDEVYCRRKAQNYSFYNLGKSRILICSTDITKTKIRGEVYKILYNYIQNLKDRPI